MILREEVARSHRTSDNTSEGVKGFPSFEQLEQQASYRKKDKKGVLMCLWRVYVLSHLILVFNSGLRKTQNPNPPPANHADYSPSVTPPSPDSSSDLARNTSMGTRT